MNPTPTGPAERDAVGLRAVNLALVSNAVLAVAKVGVGVGGRSPALVADGVNSLTDMAYAIVVRVFVGRAQEPPDREHPYGHRQLESIAALVVGSFVMATAIAVFVESLDSMLTMLDGAERFGGATTAALGVAVGTVLLKIVLWRATLGLGRGHDMPVVGALALDHRNDVIAAVGVVIGILGGRNGLPWADPLAGALVGLVILRTGIEILRDATADLMDTGPDADTAAEIEALVRGVPGVQALEQLRVHRYGPQRMLSLTIGVDGDQSVRAGDAIADAVEIALRDGIDQVTGVYVHYHPSGTPHPEGARDARRE